MSKGNRTEKQLVVRVDGAEPRDASIGTFSATGTFSIRKAEDVICGLKRRLHQISAIHAAACLVALGGGGCRHVLSAGLLISPRTATAAAGLQQTYGNGGVRGTGQRRRRSWSLRMSVVRNF